MKWAEEEAMAAFTCPLLGICLDSEGILIFSLELAKVGIIKML